MRHFIADLFQFNIIKYRIEPKNIENSFLIAFLFIYNKEKIFTTI